MNDTTLLCATFPNAAEAERVAETVLNDDLSGTSLQPGARRGVIGGRHWRATLRPQAALGTGALENGSILLDVRIEVDVSAGRTLEVETLRVSGGTTE